MPRFVTRLAISLSLPGLFLAAAFVTASRVSATPSNCGVVPVALVDAKLEIDAAHVTPHRPASPHGALICSYFGNSGRAANEATINYLPASPTTFVAVEASLAKTHSIRKIAGIGSGAYTYFVAPDRFLYVLDGTTQVQIFATVSLGRLEALGRALPRLS